MASYHIAPPERFNFSQPDQWPKWIRRFERFRLASGLTEKGEESQVNTLVYAMGDEADDILCSLGLTEEEKTKYDTVVAKLEGYFVKRRNVIFERAKFNQRRQENGESVDNFITSLYVLAEHCGFGPLHDEMVRDRIVVGLQDAALATKLQMDPELTLDKAVAAARQNEAIKNQQSVVRGGDKQNIDVISSQPQHKAAAANRSGRRQAPVRNPQTPVQPQQCCSWCGRTPVHSRQECPAREATCHNCAKKGHFQSVCRSARAIRAVQSDIVTQPVADVFLGVVEDRPAEITEDNPWKATVSVNGALVPFKIDTGADATVIPESLFTELKGTKLQPSTRVLSGPSSQPLQVCGQFTGTLQYGVKNTQQVIFVVRNLHNPLLGCPAIEALDLVARVHVVDEKALEIRAKYPNLFQGLGTLEGEYHIKLAENAQPFALTTPRRVALPLLPKVKAELERMEHMGVIARVDEPTEWCAGMVVVPKHNDTVRICVDLTKLNNNVHRERHILPSVDQILAQLSGAKVFSKLDANSGFWQVKLAHESALLTTFLTPFGRFCFNRLPFGITSAPEYFQKQMSKVLSGLDGVVCMMDDILVYGCSQEEHDDRLAVALRQIERAGVTLNKEKCKFSMTSITFLGQLVTATGICPDPQKVKAILELKEPANTSELRRFLGMANQMSKFTPELAEKAKPLRDLLSKQNQWSWGEQQKHAFAEIKRVLSSAPTLALYDPGRETVVSADASSYGLGGVLLQRQSDGELRPVAYASRALTGTEQRYAQLEKEALAITWACERFQDYLLGMAFYVQTDHKPLVPLLGSKNLDELPVRVQRFKMRLMRFSFGISHVPGKSLITADALSRAPIRTSSTEERQFSDEVEAYVSLIVNSLPATENRLQVIKKRQEEDAVCKRVMQYCQEGWPSRSAIEGALKPYHHLATELSVHEGLLMRGDRLVIPTQLQLEILDKLHEGHQGLTKCRQRARQSVWWPGLNRQLETLVQNCPKCCRERVQPAEPLIPTTLPTLPWQRVATDLFKWEANTYLLVIDYFSRYIEIAKLPGETAVEIIRHMKSIFARHGIPELVMSDNGPQFSSAEFSKFAGEYDFVHVTSSPKYPQSNGEAERAVKTIKCLLKKSKDPYMALLAYRSTPLSNGYSPAELLMNRKLRSSLPITPEQLLPQIPDYSQLREKEERAREKQKATFDTRHRSQLLEPLLPGEEVWIADQKTQGTVVRQAAPRSYTVETPGGMLRRNRRHLNRSPPEGPTVELPGDQATASVCDQTPTPSPEGTVQTRSGRLSAPPERMDPSWWK